MDEFDSKRDMIQMLLQLLKGSASDEVMGGMKTPEPLPGDTHGLEVEKIKVMPHDGEEATPEDAHDEPPMADSILKKGEPADDEADQGLMDEEDDMPSSPFASFLKKKK